MKKYIIIVFLYHKITTSLISFFIERQSTINGYDFLHLFIHEEGSKNKEKIIFRIPKSLRNLEVFKLKICKNGTINALKKDQGIDETVKNNCITDAYNSIIIIDYEEKSILNEIPIYNIYKLCVFGFGFAEGVKSYMITGTSGAIFNNEISDSKKQLYYHEVNAATELFEEAHSMNYLDLFNESEAYRCKMKIDDDLGELENEKFGKDVYFVDRSGESSYLVVEYNFQDDFAPKMMLAQKYLTTEMNPDIRTYRREQFINKLKQNLQIVRSSFYKSEFEFTIYLNENNTSIPSMRLLRNGSLETFQSINVKIEVGRFIRFFPILCNKLLEKKIPHSFEFLGEHACTPLSDDKVLIGIGEQGNPYFFNSKNDRIIITKNLKLYAEEMDFYVYPKSSPKDTTSIHGYIKKCDTVFDQNFDVLYYVCYQNMQVFEDGQEIKPDEEDFKVNHFILQDNSIPRNFFKKKIKGIAFKYFFIAAVIFSILSIIAFFFLTGGIACIVVAILGVISGIMMAVGTYTTKKKNLYYQGIQNLKKSHQKYKEMNQRIWKTPVIFYNKEKETNTPTYSVIVRSDIKLDKIETMIPKKKENFLLEKKDITLIENSLPNIEREKVELEEDLNNRDISKSIETDNNNDESLEEQSEKLDGNNNQSENDLKKNKIVTEVDQNIPITKIPQNIIDDSLQKSSDDRIEILI